MKMKIKSLIIILCCILFNFVNSDERLVVTGADEPVSARAGEDVTLNCSVDAHLDMTELQVKWKKTDVVVLLYADGENRPDSQHHRYSGRAEFFTEEIAKGNFSMKLRKVKTEDIGEFMCEVETLTDVASATARIAALDYSSLHWCILVLCITAIAVVLLTGAFSVWNYTKTSNSLWALLCHWSHVAVPQIMVFSAFILWGVTEVSTGETVTCVAISLLSILLLSEMYPNGLYPGVLPIHIYLAQTVVNDIFIIAVCTDSVIDFSTKHPITTARKTALGVLIGGFVLLMVIMAVIQYFFWFWFLISPVERLKKVLQAIFIFLMIIFLAIAGGLVFLATNFSGVFLCLTILQIIIILIPFAVFVILLIYLRKGAGFKFFKLSQSLSMILSMQIITLYIQLITWMQHRIVLEYIISIIIASLGICACVIAKMFLFSSRHFYVGQKIVLGILFTLYLILSFLHICLTFEHDEGRPVRICEAVFIYILVLSNNNGFDLKQYIRTESRLAKPCKCVYFSGTFGLPFVNSVALAVVLNLKAGTGKQPFDLRLPVLISVSVVLFGWFVMQMCAYYLARKVEIKDAFTKIKDHVPDQVKPNQIHEEALLLHHADQCLWVKQNHRESWLCYRPQCRTRRKVLEHMAFCQAGMSCQVQHCASSQEIILHLETCRDEDCGKCLGLKGYRWRYKGLHDNQETHALISTDHNGPNTGPNTEERSHDSLEMEGLSPAGHSEPNTEGSHDSQGMEASSSNTRRLQGEEP